jgi:hypothetical protein
MKTKAYALTAHSMSLIAGAAGSGRFPDDTGVPEADAATKNAEMASRYAGRDATREAHESAGDLHFAAGKAHAAAGNELVAEKHFAKAASHYKTAKLISPCDASDAKGSEAIFSDKGALEKEHQRNLREGGGSDGGDALHQKQPGPKITCPNCQKSFALYDQVGGNAAEAVCPYCSEPFKLE